ncbi:hypothetical protein [Bradyrhizobium sp. CCBAU 51627]|uniref:hypothetical protein n=1 Tax=Bradyrhizobium sp. CCBAU 51627 TaxID=1325088 RepID=UPI002305D4B9|nr:hypothetical protein [Bradyrhizobium sp. CCBAU 51627]MDA9431062.1 hypothetical protein [Bradyrhizobium sp. CCBAU 51627]
MHRYVARANVDHYIGLLNGSEFTPHNRSAIIKMLVAEEDQLSHDLEHLEFAESRAANGRDRVNHVRNLRERFSFGTAEREQADRLLANVENLQTLLEDFCHRLRERINSRGI